MNEKNSPLYDACCRGCLSTVQEILPRLSLEEINRIEPNGNTCLHGACYANNQQIVHLLLDNGAVRTIRNKFNRIPVDETNSSQIKELFRRSSVVAKERFSDEYPEGKIEWINTENAYRARMNRNDMIRLKHKTTWDAAISILEDVRFQTISGRSKLEYFLKESIQQIDPLWLLKAYSAETGFYNAINEVLAASKSSFIWNNPENFLKFIGCLYTHESLKKYRYFGVSYRGMKLYREDFEKNYQIGKALLIKPFTSTSKQRNVAEFFVSAHSTGDYSTIPVLCIYIIPESTKTSNEASVALDISTISEFPDEEEILILPHVSFKIQTIKYLPTEITEIEFMYYDAEAEANYFSL